MLKVDMNSEKPIFIQIAEGLEDAILSGALDEGGQLPSITELSVQYTINPATALKGINLLGLPRQELMDMVALEWDSAEKG